VLAFKRLAIDSFRSTTCSANSIRGKRDRTVITGGAGKRVFFFFVSIFDRLRDKSMNAVTSEVRRLLLWALAPRRQYAPEKRDVPFFAMETDVAHELGA
jgi:hypothetical protein